MTTIGFTTTLLLDKSPAEVFDAILHVRDWWHGEVEGATEKVGDKFTYRMKTFHYSKQRITELIPDKKLVWLVLDSTLSFVGNQHEWTGTTISFDITQQDGKTALLFTHYGLVPSMECYNGCSNGWHMLMHKSLQSLVNTGKGQEVF